MKLKTALLLLAAILSFFSCTKRQPEEIDYAPNSPFNPYPPDSSTNIDHTTLDVTLRWTATDPNSGDVLTYAIYFDTLNPPSTQITSGLSSTSYFMTGLSYNTTYYWKLYLTDDKGVTTNGPTWRFTTLPHPNIAPNFPAYIAPLDGTTNTYPTLDLYWTCSDPDGLSDTLAYTIALGITANMPSIGTTNNMTFEAASLNYQTDYYWKIIATDNHGAVTIGPVSVFRTMNSPWFLKAPLPTPRCYLNVATVNGKIYAIGGTDALGNISSAVEEYDPASNYWTPKTSMPTARTQAGVAVWDNKIYILGGCSRDRVYNTVEAYDPVTNSWSTKAPLSNERFGLGAGMVNNKIYVFGGDTAFGGLYSFKLVEEYNPLTDTWNPTTKRSMVGLRTHFFSTPLGNQIYVIGGLSGTPLSPVNWVHAFEPSTNRWLRKPYLLKARSDGAAAVADSCVYVMGGTNGTILRRVEMLDPTLTIWEYKGDMLTSRLGLGAITANGYIYAIGGANPLTLDAVEEYRPELDPKAFGRK